MIICGYFYTEAFSRTQTHVGEVKEEGRARKRLTYFRGLVSCNTHLSESMKGKEMGVCGS